TAGKGFFISTDGGETFTSSSAGLAAGWTEKVFAPAGAAGPIFAQLSVGLFRQDAPGAWVEIQAPFGSEEKAKIDGIVFDRSAPKRVFAHRREKWWRSEDSGRRRRAFSSPQSGRTAAIARPTAARPGMPCVPERSATSLSIPRILNAFSSPRNRASTEVPTAARHGRRHRASREMKSRPWW